MPLAGCAGQLRLGALRLRLPAPGPAALLLGLGEGEAGRRRVADGDDGQAGGLEHEPVAGDEPEGEDERVAVDLLAGHPLSITTRSSSLPPRASTTVPSTTVTSAPAARSVPACALGLTRAAAPRRSAARAGRRARRPAAPRRARARRRADRCRGTRRARRRHPWRRSPTRGCARWSRNGALITHERALVDADRGSLLQHCDLLRGGRLREQLVDALAVGPGRRPSRRAGPRRTSAPSARPRPPRALRTGLPHRRRSRRDRDARGGPRGSRAAPAA